MFNNKSDTPLFLKARAVREKEVIADALNELPNICKQLRSIGWSLALEQLEGDIDFHCDNLAYAMAHNVEQGRRMVTAFAALLDRYAEDVCMEECIIQAWYVDEKMDKPVRNLAIHWSRDRATNPKVVPLFPGRRNNLQPGAA